MAAVAAIILAILRSGRRSLRAAGAFTGNNLAGIIALLMAEEPRDRPSSTTVIYLFIGLLWAIPMAREVNRRIPPECYLLWPLKTWQRGIIHAFNIILNPLIVIAALFGALSRDPVIGWALFVIGAAAPLAVLAGDSILGDVSLPLGWIPRMPGRMGGLIQNHLRELLQLLDAWFALIVASSGAAWLHFGSNTDKAAPVVFGHLVILLMSTLAQGHVGFDAGAAGQRLRLLPVSGSEVLIAKDAAWLIVVVPLIVWFPLVPCLAAALIALAMGHRNSISPAIEQRRWSFASGRLAPDGLLQMIALIATGAAANSWGWPVLPVVVMVYAASVWWSGRRWDRWPSP